MAGIANQLSHHAAKKAREHLQQRGPWLVVGIFVSGTEPAGCGAARLLMLQLACCWRRLSSAGAQLLMSAPHDVDAGAGAPAAVASV